MKKEQLPKNWSTVKLEETGEYINGFAFKPNHRESTGLPIIRIQNLTDETKPLNRTNIAVPSAYEVFRGDMLVSWSATLDVFIWRREKALVNQHIFKVNPEESVIKKSLLFYWLKIAIEDLQETEHLHGSTMKHINRGPFLAHEVPLPPSAEQTRIVEKLEELLSDLDAGVSELKAAQKKLGQYRQSLLKAAVEGALTAQWRAQHTPTKTGAQLLERILKERRARWEAKQLAKFEEQGKAAPKDWQKKYPEPMRSDISKLAALPNNWCWATTELAGDVLLGRQRAPQYLTGRWPRPYLRVANIKDDRIDFSDVESMDFDTTHFEKYKLSIGDILVSEGQSPELVGQSSIFRGHPEPLCFQKTLHRFRAYPGIVLPEYAQLVFRAHVKNGVFRAIASITTNIAHLTLEKFEAVHFPLPPLSEQIEIVAIAESELSRVTALELDIKTSLKQSAAQRKNILKAAFSGQLVPQDPGDEPAAVLLERIRAERAHASAPERKPRRGQTQESA